jgi:hypothetical protein
MLTFGWGAVFWIRGFVRIRRGLGRCWRFLVPQPVNGVIGGRIHFHTAGGVWEESLSLGSCGWSGKVRGTLERSLNMPLAASARRCSYAGCGRPEESSKYYQIWEGKTSGGQDWSSIAGSVLCDACYSSFHRRGTLERKQRPLPHSKAARANLKPLGQVAAQCGGRTRKRKAACWDDDTRGKGGSSASGGECREGGGSKGKRRVVANLKPLGQVAGQIRVV